MILINAIGEPVRAYRINASGAIPRQLRQILVTLEYGAKNQLPPSRKLIQYIESVCKAQGLPCQIRWGKQHLPSAKGVQVTLPSSYLVKLKPHQRRILPASTASGRYLLADDVGLGKTVEAIAAFNQMVLRDPKLTRLLVVTLKSLLGQWQEELGRWLLPEVQERVEVTVTNWDQLRLAKHDHWVGLYTGQAVIYDEAHLVKNRKAARTQAAAALAHRAKYAWLLTGTPLEKAPDDMWQLLNMLDPKVFSSYWNFRKVFVLEEKTFSGYPKIIGTKNSPILKDMTQPYYVRRTRDILELQEPQVIERWGHMAEGHRSAYQFLEKTLWEEIKDKPILNAISRQVYLRQCAIHPQRELAEDLQGKLLMLPDLLEGTGDHKVLVFTSFRWSSSLAARTLCPDWNLLHYEAGMPDTVLQQFREDPKVKVLVSTTGALGVGHNLQVANVLCFLDLPLSGIAYKQAVGRIVRIGQKEQPLIYHLMMRDTVDEIASRRLKLKEAAFTEALIVQDWIEKMKGVKHAQTTGITSDNAELRVA